MKEILLEVVSKVFDKIPFSKKEEFLKKELSDQLIEKYEASVTPDGEIEKATELLAECKNLESICSLVGYEEENLQQYSEVDHILGKEQTKKIIGKIRKYIYLQCFLLAICFERILLTLFQFSIHTAWYNILFVLLYAGLLFYVTKRKRKYLVQCDYENLRFDSNGRQTIYALNDSYSKKLLNTSMAMIGILAYFIFNTIYSIISLKYTFNDVNQQVIYTSFFAQLMLYLLGKNYLCKKITDVFFVRERSIPFKKQWLRVSLAGGIYFIVLSVALLMLHDTNHYIFNWFFAFEIIYVLLCGTYNLFKRKRLVFHNITVNVKKIVLVSLLVLSIGTYNVMSMDLYLTQPYINKVPKVLEEQDQIDYNEDSGVYTITTQKEDFKILQLTDIHLGGSIMSVAKDTKALQACFKLINHTKPDLVIVTGDLVFPMGVMSFSLNNNAPIMQFANFMRNTGIPWAFTYGNHDTESMATLDEIEFGSLMESLSYQSSESLLYPYVQPDIYGRSNQMIEIRNADGSLKQALFLLDSNDYIAGSGKLNEYDYIHDDQVEWYEQQVLELSEQEGYTIPSMLFFHIPLMEYKEANDLYESGSNEVTYYYGNIGEKMIDKICCSKYESKLFDTAVKLGSTKAMFCGHDHYNNQSVEYKGIRLTYGYSIDYLVMPGIDKHQEQRGATLITIDDQGDFTIEPYRLNDLE